MPHAGKGRGEKKKNLSMLTISGYGRLGRGANYLQAGSDVSSLQN